MKNFAPPHYLRLMTMGLVLTAAIFLGLPSLLRLYDPTAGNFNVETLNAVALGAVLLAGVLHSGFFAYRQLFPRFYDYQRECVEENGKMFENITDDLRRPLFPAADVAESLDITQAQTLAILTERRKVAQFQFIIRCVRFLLCFLVLAYCLHLASDMVKTAMLAVPGGAPVL